MVGVGQGSGPLIRRFAGQSLVDPVPIVVIFERLQFPFQIPLAPEQHPVQILPPEGADEPLDEWMGDGHIGTV